MGRWPSRSPDPWKYCQKPDPANSPVLEEYLVSPVNSSTPTVPYSAVLDELEAEAIHIYRETAAAFKNPVLLYSIGKDSSVLLHLAVRHSRRRRSRSPSCTSTPDGSSGR